MSLIMLTLETYEKCATVDSHWFIQGAGFRGSALWYTVAQSVFLSIWKPQNSRRYECVDKRLFLHIRPVGFDYVKWAAVQ